MPPEVERAIDKRSSMAAIGNLNDFVKYQMGKGMESGSGGGPGGTAAELAVGFGIAQQMMQQGFSGGHATPTVAPPVPAAAAPGLPELLGPAEAAQALGVSEADVIAVLESGDLKGKKNRIELAYLASGVDDIHVLTPLDSHELRGETWPTNPALEKHACPACGA